MSVNDGQLTGQVGWQQPPPTPTDLVSAALAKLRFVKDHRAEGRYDDPVWAILDAVEALALSVQLLIGSVNHTSGAVYDLSREVQMTRPICPGNAAEMQRQRERDAALAQPLPQLLLDVAERAARRATSPYGLSVQSVDDDAPASATAPDDGDKGGGDRIPDTEERFYPLDPHDPAYPDKATDPEGYRKAEEARKNFNAVEDMLSKMTDAERRAWNRSDGWPSGFRDQHTATTRV